MHGGLGQLVAVDPLGRAGDVEPAGDADAVTEVAAEAAAADAAATMIANAVNVDHPAVSRMPARELRADSDLGDLLVTAAVGALPASARAEALAQGRERARVLQRQGLIYAAYLALQGEVRAVLPATLSLGRQNRRCRTSGSSVVSLRLAAPEPRQTVAQQGSYEDQKIVIGAVVVVIGLPVVLVLLAWVSFYVLVSSFAGSNKWHHRLIGKSEITCSMSPS